MALEGDLSIFRLPDILQVISQQQKTGILTVQGENDILAVSFHQGRIVAADALNQSFEEMLGDVLASQGILAPERFQRLSEEHRSTAGERLADFLIRRGALTREQLLAALRFQTYRLLLEVLRWRQGEFKFYGGDEVAYEEGMEPLPVDEVLYRSMRDLLGEGTMAGALPHGFVAYEAVATDRTLKVAREPATTIERDPAAVWISQDERTLLDHLDGHTPAEKLARDTGLGELRTQYALFHLLRSGLVRPAGEAPAPEEIPAAPAAPVAGPRPERKPAAEREPAPPAAPEILVAAPERVGLGRVAGGVAGLLLAATLAASALRPALVLLPYPAQRPEREGFARLERQARLAAIDGAARRYYLLEGRYPASLDDLVLRGMLVAAQRSDAAGHRLVLEPADDRYTLMAAGERGADAAKVTESVAGDVLLDRTMFAQVQEESGVPWFSLSTDEAPRPARRSSYITG